MSLDYLRCAAFGGVMGLLAGAAVMAAPSGGENLEVKIDNFTFVPQSLTVKAGTTVTWVNEDDIPHGIVTSNTKTFRSKVMDTDEKYAFTFTTPGTYEYFCYLHPHMTGTIVVEPVSGGGAAP
jgi:plastocyanin